MDNGVKRNFGGGPLACWLSGEGEQHRWRSRRSSRRLITLIFEGRNLMKIIRRELPLTRCADLVPAEFVSLSQTRCIKGTRVLLVMVPSTATSTARSLNISIVNSVADSAAFISRSDPVVNDSVFGIVIGFGSQANLPDEAEQLATNGGDERRFVFS